ncbi:MAG: DUF3160 domain-containing protein [Planctomycetes bacterium]|nr:DUF3160 domain-containing protein [Planctomycetota bacterium]
MRTILLACGLVLGAAIVLPLIGDFEKPASAVREEVTRQADFVDFLQREKGLTPAAFQARYVPRPTAPDDLRINLGQVEYLELIQKRIKPKAEAQPLSDAELRALAAQGLAVLETRAFPSFGDAFYDIFANDQPLFVTSDAVLHAFHKSYDRLLMELETVYLSPLLASLLRGGFAGLGEVRTVSGRDAVVAQAADDVELLFEVARELLKGSPRHANPRVNEILRAVATETPLRVKFLGRVREIDFSQFRPRGHYTKSEELKQYFRAMMWLGREDLAFRISDSFREIVAAFLMVDVLKRGASYSKWEDFDRTISFLVGAPDGANPRALLALLDKLGYRDFDDFVRRATPVDTLARIGSENIGEQKILSAICRKDPGEPQIRLPKSAQLLGQRFTLDSYLFNQLTYDRATGPRPRLMPRPLDLPAAMGRPRAIELLKPDLDRFGHQESLAACIEYLKAVPEAFWNENVYHGWLDVLREVGAEPPAGAPGLVKTRAWADLKLQTQLASWAQLRHDTILYTKQSYSIGITCEYCDVYVEPNPPLFGKLRALCERTASLLKDAPSDSAPSKAVLRIYELIFTRFATTMDRLKSVAEKELAGKPIDAQERKFLHEAIEIKRSGGCGGPKYFLSGWYPTLFAEPKTCLEWDPTIADVHTQPTDEAGGEVGNVLHVGVGNVNLAAFLVTGHDGKMRAYLGPVFSYYEVIEGGYNRLTDEKWKERVWCPATRLVVDSAPLSPKGPKPTRPAWTEGLFGR